MQCDFYSQNKRIQPTCNNLRNNFNNFNSVFIFAFLPRRPKSDKIGQSFKSQTKCDEMRQPIFRKCDKKCA